MDSRARRRATLRCIFRSEMTFPVFLRCLDRADICHLKVETSSLPDVGFCGSLDNSVKNGSLLIVNKYIVKVVLGFARSHTMLRILSLLFPAFDVSPESIRFFFISRNYFKANNLYVVII